MGVFEVKTKVWRVGEPKSARELNLVVDTGATYTTLPASLLKEMGIRPLRRRLRLANGRIVERELAAVGLEAEGERLQTTLVVFGDEGVCLLGSLTLEDLSLAVDPLKKKLVPTEAYLLSARPLSRRRSGVVRSAPSAR